MTETKEEFEVLNQEEFMKRMDIKKSTLHKWRKLGWLKPGKHYIKNGGIIRFIWTKEIILDMCDPKIMKVKPTEPKARKKSVKRRKHAGGINLDY